jgi:hypothetical protein
MLLATSVEVEVEIKTKNAQSAAAVMKRLTVESVTTELSERGMPAPAAFAAKVRMCYFRVCQFTVSHVLAHVS